MPCGLLGPLEGCLGAFGTALGPPWDFLGCPGGPKEGAREPIWDSLGGPPLGSLGTQLGSFWDRFEVIWNHLAIALGSFGGHLGLMFLIFRNLAETGAEVRSGVGV